MKLREVIEELEKGSTKTYVAHYEDGTRIVMSPDNPKLGLDWSPVKTSVEWNVAIGEWSLGKEIYCEIGGCRFASNNKEFSITPRMISLGVWYVGD